MHEGAILTGAVKNLTDYGAFVDLGGIDGLLHITDMSWGRLTHPRDLVQVGDQIQVKVLKFDKDKQRVSLGLQAAHARSLAGCRRALSHRRARSRARHQRDRLRRFHRAGAGHRRPGARQRDDVVQAHEASLQDGQRRRPGGSRGAQCQSHRAPHLPRPEAAGVESLGDACTRSSRSGQWSKARCAT